MMKQSFNSKCRHFSSIGILSDENLSNLRENQIIIGILNPFKNKEKLIDLKKKKINCFFFRITS